MIFPWPWLPCLLGFFFAISKHMTRLPKCMWFRFWQHTPNESNHELPGKFQVIRGWIQLSWTFPKLYEGRWHWNWLMVFHGFSWFFTVFHGLTCHKICGHQKTGNSCQGAVKGHEHPGGIIRTGFMKFHDHSWMIMKSCQISILIHWGCKMLHSSPTYNSVWQICWMP